MFGRRQPVLFNSYGSRRRRRLVPRWLLLILLGLVIGAGAVIFVQERYLPPRLSADASAQLRDSFERADAERVRLQIELAETTKRLDSALAERKALAADLGSSNETAKRLREDVASLVASLPPDPRNGPVSIRAARFAVDGGALAYDVVLSRDRPNGKPLGGVMQLVVAGQVGKGSEERIALEPVPISVGSYDSVRGSLPLPQGFRPQQTTIQVLDRVGGKLLGMRVMYVGK
jgi:hypothetical protein